MSLIKQILGRLVVATAVTVACQFLPIINTIVGGYLIGIFLAAFILPIFISKHSQRRIGTGKMPVPDVMRRKKEREEWWRKSSQATSCPSNCYDLRNIDRQLHMYDGFDDD